MDNFNEKAFKTHQMQYLMSKIVPKKDNPEILLLPISFAIEQFFTSKKKLFLRHENQINPETGLPMSSEASLQLHLKKAQSVLWNVHSARLIGSNGSGKTELSIQMAVKKAQEMGLNPVIFNDHTQIQPQSPKDCLIAFYSAVGADLVGIKGFPMSVDVKRQNWVCDEQGVPVLNEQGLYQYGDEHLERTIEFSGIQLFNTLKQFNYGIIIIDEINRSSETSLFNAIINGERQDGVPLARMGTLILALANSETDGLNDTITSDMAAKTKNSMYHVYMDVETWAQHAYEKGYHPAVIGFAQQYPHWFENLQGHILELGAPTFRGAKKLSDALMNLEEEYEKLEEIQVKALVVAELGSIDSKSENIADLFASFYLTVYQDLLKKFKNRLNHAYRGLEMGFCDLYENKNYFSINTALTQTCPVAENGVYHSQSGNHSNELKTHKLYLRSMVNSLLKQWTENSNPNNLFYTTLAFLVQEIGWKNLPTVYQDALIQSALDDINALSKLIAENYSLSQYLKPLLDKTFQDMCEKLATTPNLEKIGLLLQYPLGKAMMKLTDEIARLSYLAASTNEHQQYNIFCYQANQFNLAENYSHPLASYFQTMKQYFIGEEFYMSDDHADKLGFWLKELSYKQLEKDFSPFKIKNLTIEDKGKFARLYLAVGVMPFDQVVNQAQYQKDLQHIINQHRELSQLEPQQAWKELEYVYNQAIRCLCFARCRLMGENTSQDNIRSLIIA